MGRATEKSFSHQCPYVAFSAKLFLISQKRRMFFFPETASRTESPARAQGGKLFFSSNSRRESAGVCGAISAFPWLKPRFSANLMVNRPWEAAPQGSSAIRAAIRAASRSPTTAISPPPAHVPQGSWASQAATGAMSTLRTTATSPRSASMLTASTRTPTAPTATSKSATTARSARVRPSTTLGLSPVLWI